MTKKAVIVAAGRSSRLYPLTLETPKCLLDVGGEPMISRSVRLLEACGVSDIAVVTGYQREKIAAHLGNGFTYLFNPFYPGTNNLGSLWFARDWVGQDGFLYLHADIVYHPELLGRMLAREEEGSIDLLVDMGPTDEEAMKVRLSGGRFVESHKGVPSAEACGEWVGIARFPSSPAVLAHLFDTAEQVFETDCNAYDTAAFTRMAAANAAFGIVPTDGLPWIEIDDQKDLDRARKLFA